MIEKLEPVISARGLSCGFENGFLFEDLNFDIYPGEAICVRGKSGLGKTTLLYCMSGIIPHIQSAQTAGEVMFFGKNIIEVPITEIASKLGFIFQDPDIQLFSDIIEEDIVFGPENLCFSWDEIDESLLEALRALNIEDLRDKSAKNLSGGQKQLAAIASVIAMKPQILILDEIAAQLDKNSRASVARAIKEKKDAGVSIVMIDHDDCFIDLVDRVFDLERGAWSRK